MSKPSPSQIIRTWRENPIRFVQDNFKCRPDKWQEDVLMAFASKDPKKKRISMRACAGPGKTAVLAWLGLNFLVCYGDKDNRPKGAAVSITAENLANNLWPEMAKWLHMSPFLDACLFWTKTKLFSKENPADHFISARSFPKSANMDEVGRTLAGLHAKDILYLCDESGGIPPAILRSAEQGIGPAERFGKIVQAGNPLTHSSMLYEAATSLASQWYNVRITADPLDAARTPRVPIEQAQAQIDTYGRSNPWIKVYILGEFPDAAVNTLLSLEEVEAAMARTAEPADYEFAEKRIGVDVARFGLDASCLAPRQGTQLFEIQEMRNARTNEIAARVAMGANKWGAESLFVDGTGGFGSGVVDSLIQAGYSPFEVHFSGKSPEVQYANLRAYMWFQLAAWIKRSGCLPNDPILKKELLAPTYFFNNGKFQIEDKEQIKSRLGFSPDRADACALTFFMPDRPSSQLMPAALQNRNLKKWHDPFAGND